MNSATTSTLDPTARAFLDAIVSAGGPPIYTLSPHNARGVLDGAQAGPVDLLPADIEDFEIPGGPTGAVSLRIVRPEGSSEALPVVMYFHGGGWVLGNKGTHDRLVRELAVGANVAVVFVDYSPSPESRYPVAIEQGYAALQWIVANGTSKGLDPTRLAIAGDSAGGNLAIAVTMAAKDRNGPKVDFQLLFYPVTDANFDTASYHEFAEGYFLERKGMMWFWDCYAPDPATRAEPLASPLQATLDQLKGMPSTLVVNGKNDVLCDEGRAYAQRLKDAGVAVETALYPDTIHDFVMLNAISPTPAARSAIALANDTLRRVLHP